MVVWTWFEFHPEIPPQYTNIKRLDNEEICFAHLQILNFCVYLHQPYTSTSIYFLLLKFYIGSKSSPKASPYLDRFKLYKSLILSYWK